MSSVATSLRSTTGSEGSSPQRSGRRSRINRAVCAAIGALVVRVIDDVFVQPPVGVASSDHVVSGLVPIGILLAAGAVFLHTRRRALRAWIALTLGVWGLVSGVEVVIALRGGGAGLVGGDVTGAASMLAGLILVGASLIVGWRARRGDESAPGHVVRLAGTGVLVLVTSVVVVAPISLGYVATHTSGRGLAAPPDIGVAVMRVALPTPDGLTLNAWYAPSRNGAAVIVVPGRSGRRQAEMLAGNGYGVLLLDRRGEGDSEGAPNLFGWGGGSDVTAAVDFLDSRRDVEPGAVGGLGLSVGGEILLQHVAENSRLAAVVSEGAGSRSIRESLELSGGLRAAELTMAPLLTASLVVLADQMPPPNLRSLLRDMPRRPVLMIWGQRGQPAEIELGGRYADAADAERWEVPDAGHVGGLRAAPAEYERRVIEFFDRTLIAKGGPDGHTGEVAS